MNIIEIKDKTSKKIIELCKGVYKDISGLLIDFRNDEGYVSFYKNTKFLNCRFNIGNKSKINIGSTRYGIIALNLYATFPETYIYI